MLNELTKNFKFEPIRANNFIAVLKTKNGLCNKIFTLSVCHIEFADFRFIVDTYLTDKYLEAFPKLIPFGEDDAVSEILLALFDSTGNKILYSWRYILEQEYSEYSVRYLPLDYNNGMVCLRHEFKVIEIILNPENAKDYIKKIEVD